MSIELKHIHMNYGKQTVLNDLSLAVKRGEFHVLLGASGEGKSTVLAIIAGILNPPRGEVGICGNIVTHLPPQKRDVSFVFQDYALFPHLSVFENVAYGLRALGVAKQELNKRTEHYLAMVDLAKASDKHPAELSGGQKQRVALARALATEPSVLLMDEPLSHLDSSTREQLQVELKKLQQRLEITVLYVTHNMEEAVQLADRISMLKNGQVLTSFADTKSGSNLSFEFTQQYQSVSEGVWNGYFQNNCRVKKGQGIC